MVLGGKQFRYRGTVPRTLNPVATVNLATAMLEHQVLSTIPVGRHVLLIADIQVAGQAGLAGSSIADTEQDGQARVLALAVGGRTTLDWSPRRGHLPAGDPLRDLVQQAHTDVTGGPVLRERGAPYGSDLRLYAAEGVPTLHYGPGDVRLAHGPDESVEIDEVVRVTEALVLSTLRACGTLE